MLRKMDYCTFSKEEKKLLKDIINEMQSYKWQWK